MMIKITWNTEIIKKEEETNDKNDKRSKQIPQTIDCCCRLQSYKLVAMLFATFIFWLTIDYFFYDFINQNDLIMATIVDNIDDDIMQLIIWIITGCRYRHF